MKPFRKLKMAAKTNMATTQLKTSQASSNETRARDSERNDFVVESRNGLLLGFYLPEGARFGQVEASRPARINSWLQIGSDGTVTLTIGAPEMNSSSLSFLAKVLAEELAVDSGTIKTETAGPRLVPPVASTVSGNAVSRAVRTKSWKLRSAGAIAREMLVSAAMNKNGDRTTGNYAVRRGVITHLPSRKTFTYGQVAVEASELPLPVGTPPSPIDDSQFAGSTIPRTNFPATLETREYSRDLIHRPALGGTSVPPGLPDRLSWGHV
jgi:CO/xanthine dehydrogenase Mo-binding subunit